MTRRESLKIAVVGAAGAFPAVAATGRPFAGLKCGIASYSTRKLTLEATLAALKHLQIRYIALKDFHLPMDSTREQRLAVKKQIADAGLEILGCGVITLPRNDEAQVRHALEYTRDVGSPTAVVAPDPAALPALNRVIKDFDLRVAIHNHGPEDKRFPSPLGVLEAVQGLDARIGCCVDVGHTFRLGIDPAAAIRKCAPRLYDVHLKDLADAGAKARNVPIGTGALDIVAILKALVEIRYAHHVALEYEAEPDNPLPGLAASLGYMRGVLAVS